MADTSEPLVRTPATTSRIVASYPFSTTSVVASFKAPRCPFSRRKRPSVPEPRTELWVIEAFHEAHVPWTAMNELVEVGGRSVGFTGSWLDQPPPNSGSDLATDVAAGRPDEVDIDQICPVFVELALVDEDEQPLRRC